MLCSLGEAAPMISLEICSWLKRGTQYDLMPLRLVHADMLFCSPWRLAAYEILKTAHLLLQFSSILIET